MAMGLAIMAFSTSTGQSAEGQHTVDYADPIAFEQTLNAVNGRKKDGDPNGNRTRAAAVKGRCPNR